MHRKASIIFLFICLLYIYGIHSTWSTFQLKDHNITFHKIAGRIAYMKKIFVCTSQAFNKAIAFRSIKMLNSSFINSYFFIRFCFFLEWKYEFLLYSYLLFYSYQEG